jgi:hypothetical protein
VAETLSKTRESAKSVATFGRSRTQLSAPTCHK